MSEDREREEERPAAGRVIEREIEIPAPVETVWRALTDAEELTRWFPLEARVTSGLGGSIWLSWGPPYEAESRISIWDPPRHLRTDWPDWHPVPEEDGATDGVRESPRTRDGAREGDRAVSPGEAVRKRQSVPLTVDYVLEARGGTTLLRLVHSGFGEDARWDDEYHGTRRGWNFELRGLRHYLTRHAGRRRRVVWARTPVPASERRSWEKVLGPGGLRLEPAAALREGDAYVMRPEGLPELRGRVEICEPPAIFCGTVEGLADALLRVELEGGKTPQLFVWLSTYGVPEEMVRELQGGLDAMLGRLFHLAGHAEPAGSNVR